MEQCQCKVGKLMASDRECVRYWKKGAVHNVPENGQFL